jgi:hypothetical protein
MLLVVDGVVPGGQAADGLAAGRTWNEPRAPSRRSSGGLAALCRRSADARSIKKAGGPIWPTARGLLGGGVTAASSARGGHRSPAIGSAGRRGDGAEEQLVPHSEAASWRAGHGGRRSTGRGVYAPPLTAVNATDDVAAALGRRPGLARSLAIRVEQRVEGSCGSSSRSACPSLHIESGRYSDTGMAGKTTPPGAHPHAGRATGREGPRPVRAAVPRNVFGSRSCHYYRDTARSPAR